jgi:hypothetical protein
MSHVGFRLSHGVAFAGDAGHDRNSRAVEAQMGKTNPAEKLMPFLRGVFRKIDQLVSFLFMRAPNERDEVSVQRGGVDPIAFGGEADGAPLEIDIAESNSGFGDSTTLSHCNEPRIVHPRVLFPEGDFNLLLFVGCDFGLLFWRHSFVSESQTRIGVNVIPPNCFLQNGRQNFQLSERGVECSRSYNITWRIGAELGIRSANLVRYLKRGDHIDMLQVGSDRGPGISVSSQRFWIRILVSKKSWNPNIEPVALSVSIHVQLAHGVLCGYLFDLSKGPVVVDANFGAFISPCAIWALISNPVIWACVSLIIRCHVVQHSAANQDSSMTVSRGK